MLTFTQKKSNPALRHYIHSYWLIEAGDKPEILALVPDGYPEIFFTLQGSVQIFSGGKNWQQYSAAGVIGQVTNRFSFGMAAFSKVLFVKLYPWTPAALFRLPTWHLNNEAQEIAVLTNDPAFRLLTDQVYSTENIDRSVALLEAFFLKKLASAAHESPFLQHAVRQIYASNGAVCIDTLTQKIHASRRYVEILFKEKIGLTPKQYARLIRVKKATIMMLNPDFSGQLSSIASSLNYYDQSHFLKDFKAVVQQTPTGFLQQQLNFQLADVESYLGQWDYS
ncbi:MAG: helix-turn-helix transcriptional regulator [Saprospiraceae bacterium]|jgi:AraC-like DNA-binding protein|nr:helix-turn-helix transcriptional regulator [Saprospiraceae bacterium]